MQDNCIEAPHLRSAVRLMLRCVAVAFLVLVSPTETAAAPDSVEASVPMTAAGDGPDELFGVGNARGSGICRCVHNGQVIVNRNMTQRRCRQELGRYLADSGVTCTFGNRPIS